MKPEHPAPRQPGSPPATLTFLAGALIAGAALAAYHNSFSAPFEFDDIPTIVDNPTIRHLWNLKTVLSPPTGGYTVSGRPVVNLTLAINYALGGTNPWGYHATNLLIHILAGLTLFGIARRTLPRMGIREGTGLAFCIALIWILHPLQTESVTYVIQRAESLMGLLYLFTLYAFIRFAGKASGGTPLAGVETDNVTITTGGASAVTSSCVPPCGTSEDSGAGRKVWGWLAVGACALGMATKEVMVSAPLIIFLYDRTFVSGSFRAALVRWRFYAGLALTWVLLAWLVSGSGSRNATAGIANASDPARYWLTQFYAVGHYLSLAFWPRPLVFDYGLALVRSPAEILPSILVVSLVVIGSAACLIRTSLRPLGFAGTFFLAILAPTSVIPVIVQVIAEHRVYLALAPLVFAVVAGSFLLVQGVRPPEVKNAGFFTSGGQTPVYFVLCVAAAAALGFATERRNGDYRSPAALWGTTAAEMPTNARALCNYGLALADEGKTAASIALYRRALVISPGYPEAHNNLGIGLSKSGQWDEAIGEFREALRIEPTLAKASFNLGKAYSHQARYAEAARAFDEARRLNPGDPDVDYNLGAALTAAGRPEDAIPVYERALALEPDLVYVQTNLGVLLAGMGRFPEAIGHYRAALRLEPGLSRTHNDLGIALATTGKLADATAEFELAVRLDPNFYLARFNLARALMIAGRTAEGREQYLEAARLQSTPQNPAPEGPDNSPGAQPTQ